MQICLKPAPQEAFNSQRTRDEDIRDFEQDFHKSLG